ncbi:MAG: hypothetical protein HeimC3_32300 [Candidatus Heimdallarchaeota archaeon LC_3]|nr:MAG: hypothetical protein HeimC3_32300 [Candidatus Heimdallarchaeota archaeon LC_3]
MTDISIYYNEIAFGIEYIDHTFSDNSTSAYFLLIFQREDVIIHDFDHLVSNSIDQISVFDHKVLIWGENGFYLRDTDSNFFMLLLIPHIAFPIVCKRLSDFVNDF